MPVNFTSTPQVRFVDAPDLDNIAALDSLPVPMLARMMRYGTAVDVDYLRDLGEQMEGMYEDTKAEIQRTIPVNKWEKWMEADVDEFNPASADQVAALLFDVLGLGRGIDLARTAGGKVSTNKKQLQVIAGEHEIVQLLLRCRELQKLKSTYCDALVREAVHHPKGKCPICSIPGEEVHHREGHFAVHTTFTHTRTETGRIASKKINLQNIPAKTELGALIRRAFIARPGKVLVTADYSQIELRVLAHCAKEKGMLKVFRDGGDIHLATAAEVFKVPLDEVDPIKHRLPCKNVNFGIVYGLSWIGLQAQLALSGLFWEREECEGFINSWFERRQGVRGYMRECIYWMYRYGYVWDFFGRVRYCPGGYSAHRRIRSAAEREAGNMPIQSGAAGIMKLGMAAVDRADDGVREIVTPLLTIHDEVMEEADEEYGEAVLARNIGLMSGVVELDCPVEVDGKVMEEWVK